MNVTLSKYSLAIQQYDQRSYSKQELLQF